MLHAAGDVGDVGETVLKHPLAGAGAAHADGAMDEVFGLLREVGDGIGPSTKGKELGTFNVGHEILVLFTDVEKDAVEALSESLS